MGISTYQSYCGAQIFDAIGLDLRVRRDLLHRHGDAHRRRRAQRDRRGDRAPPPRRLWRRPELPHHDSTSAATTRSASAARRRSGRSDGSNAAARGARQCPRRYRQFLGLVNERRNRYSPSAGCSAQDPADEGRPRSRSTKSSRREHRAALLDRRDVVWLDLARGTHHASHCHEPHRRQVEHRRGRRGSRPLQAAAQWRFHALGDQPGGLRPVRRHRGVSRQLRHDADQDGAGRQARRGRAVARPQGRPDHRRRPPLDARRRPHLAAAAPRHLFDRGSGAAHLRPQERQPRRAGVGEARLRSRCRHRRRRRLEGARRPRHHRRLRRRHRRRADSPR